MTDTMVDDTPLVQSIPPYVRAMQPYRPGKPLEELKEEYGFERVIKLASNENPFGTSPKALAAMQAVLSDTFRYPDPVSRRLRRKIAASLGISPAEIVVGAGSESLLVTLIRTLMQPGEEAVTAEGAFMGFEIHLNAHGGRLRKVPAPSHRFDAEALIAATTGQPRILYLPNPNNPTGTYLTHTELAAILAAVPPTTLVLLDEAYVEFCGHLSDYPQALTLRRDNLILLRTFSKAYGLAGLRVGYAIGSPGLIEHLGKVKMTFEPNLLAQAAAEAAWDDHEFLNRGIANNRQELARYETTLTQLGLAFVPSAGNFVMVPCADSARVEALNTALLQRGIAVRPLGAFGFPEALRITIGQPSENDALFQALETILPTLG